MGHFRGGAKRLLERRLAPSFDWALVHLPGTVFQLAGIVGTMTDWWSWSAHCVRTRDVRDVFATRSRLRAAWLARGIRSVELRNRALETYLQRHGFECPDGLIRWRGLEFLERLRAEGKPAILLTWHTGPHQAVFAALARLQEPVGFVGAELPDFQTPERWQVFNSAAQGTAPTAAIRRALSSLRGGGLVVVSGDGRHGTSAVEVTCLGRLMTRRTGAAALARLTGAPVFPVVASWRFGGGRLDVTVHEALAIPPHCPDAASFDRAVVTAAARWYESYIECHPAELPADRLRELLDAPRTGRTDRMSPRREPSDTAPRNRRNLVTNSANNDVALEKRG